MQSNKLHRWLDFLAALLARRAPATFVELAREIPGYLADGSVAGNKPSDTLKRMFERDKLERRSNHLSQRHRVCRADVVCRGHV